VFLKDLPPKELMQGIRGYYAHGENMTLGLVEIEAGTVMPLHQHIHEQITYLLEGQLDMEIGGIAHTLTAGSYYIQCMARSTCYNRL
jgi:quercetin dioxygenase-like cupin family protein